MPGFSSDNPFQSGPFRTPYYGPGQGPALMQDPAAAMIMMFGMPLLQGTMGSDKFLPHFTPNQALMDQFMASQYQRSNLAASLAASRMGEEAVSDRVLGIASMLTGTPASQLNREQANNLASMINHPIAKMMLGQLMGPENMEALMFGRRGDPAALASAVGRVGFFRRDALGSERMNAQSLEDFSKAIHANLYGEGANVDDMRGFMAGQAGQIFENLFQRGMLPQSIGALSAAERVRLLGDEANRDPVTMDRLADEFGRRELMKSDRTFDVEVDGKKLSRRFNEVTEEEQKLILERERPGFRSRLDDTFERIDEFRKEDFARGKSPAEMETAARDIEKLAGYDVTARNVDASKTSGKIKEFAGAVAAVREIFGDNGNPNAPMPALLAALEQLTQGALPQMSAKGVEGTMRQMRLAAREAGIGMEQLMGMSAQIGAYGDTLGIARPVSMQNTLNTALLTKAMREAGSFSNPRFGQTDQATAAQDAGMAMQRGDASGVGMTLAAMRRAVETNPELYAGTEAEALVNAYKNNQTTYTFDGRTVNLANTAGKGGAPALAEIFTRSNGSMATLNMYSLDQMTQKYMNAGYTYELQSAELQRDVTNGVLGGMVMDRLDLNSVRDTARALGVSEKDAEDARFAFGKTVSDQLAGVIIKETGGMEPEERQKYLRDKLPELMKNVFMEGGVADPAEAERRAEAFMPLLFGANEKEQLDVLGRMISAVDLTVQNATGKTLTALDQRSSPEVIANYRREQVVNKNRAERMGQMQRGRESSLLQRIGEEAERVGQGGTFTIQDSIERITNILDVAGLRDAYAPELAQGFGRALEIERGLVLQDADVLALADAAEKGGAGGADALKKLKFLAGVDEKMQVVADDAKDIDPNKQITRTELRERARSQVGTAAGFTEEARRENKKKLERLNDYYQAMVSGDKADLVTAASDNLAEDAALKRRLSEEDAEKLRGRFEKAALGDKDELNALRETLSEDEFKMLEGLQSASTLAKHGIVLSSDFMNQTINVKSEEVARKQMEAAAEAARKERENLETGIDAAAEERGTPRPAGAGAAAAAGDKPARPRGVGAETTRTESMSVEASKVTVNMAREAASGQTAAAESRGVKAAPATGGAEAQSNELTINGTIALRNLYEGIVSVTGERPIDTPDGPSVFPSRGSGMVMG